MARRYLDKRARHNKHVDLSKQVVIQTEDFLFDLLDKNKNANRFNNPNKKRRQKK